MINKSVLKSLFEKISSDSSLRKMLMEAIQPPTGTTGTRGNMQSPGQKDQHNNNGPKKNSLR